MKKITTLVTGSNGFVGKYLVSALEEAERYEIIPFPCDIRDREETAKLIQTTKPSLVYHLAAQPFVPRAIEDPWETEAINVGGTLNLLESLHRLQSEVRMLYVSSADVYGRQNQTSLPLHEELIANPINPYSGSKLAAESYCRQYSAFSKTLSVIIARPFNHIGIGQRPEFVIPNFCNQIIEAKRKHLTNIQVGDLNPTRDFSNVKDIVEGYLLLMEKGESGQIYNICSGEETSIRTVVEKLIAISGVSIECKVDESRIRSAETSRVFGDNRKLKRLGWSSKRSLEDTLLEIYREMENLNSV
ncbi:GDP-mannose 4,6-dehydratase [Leptospira idonii]|uniref:NAD-dependent epimerase/dehydratase family protein n=1 Tax=Leptospira idonii TaxID=1193500 RepID=A0A4R9LTS6_9LEPT|nr:GDP-mannose 4,6-dehydratase [Leptospira idonii]TGN17126.1 NAD-dependent epimerase/dehydratase family protein [Leptospira idonii]